MHLPVRQQPFVALSLLLAAACGSDSATALATGPAQSRLAVAPSSVSVADLGLPPGELDVSLRGINDAGIIIASGYSDRAYISQSGACTELGRFEGARINP